MFKSLLLLCRNAQLIVNYRDEFVDMHTKQQGRPDFGSMHTFLSRLATQHQRTSWKQNDDEREIHSADTESTTFPIQKIALLADSLLEEFSIDTVLTEHCEQFPVCEQFLQSNR